MPEGPRARCWAVLVAVALVGAVSCAQPEPAVEPPAAQPAVGASDEVETVGGGSSSGSGGRARGRSRARWRGRRRGCVVWGCA